MFTGIIEATGKIVSVQADGTNLIFGIAAPFLSELKIDQSVAHNGVCLTVDGMHEDFYTVTTIHETLVRTNLGQWKAGRSVNLERCMQANGRLDGHIVQGHVDGTGTLASVTERAGSHELVITYAHEDFFTVEKGSICLNGISLTVVRSEKGLFSVEIIPYTWEHTNLHALKTGDPVNLEFDIIGKYVTAYMKRMQG